ncbi:anthranilate synthase component II [Aquibacillus albus]|uniref:Anthranilate synthase/aminodeoxychorismate synthase-like glutamine amidotransferase n=1 Tax=Aquibacillus albus TaxID=1168171 RepID=A0ABS2MYY9_9BACI|nr:aminodeoxychorismate/anthranilate synthase component II [Aquibacillus albus]MBM7571008.1 anthranilate synthase/aminodeoxychorismate synthase-like glutamine amidotransferase [Aquibacillus albus]
MIIIIDNYDSFTYNLVQYYKQLDPDVHVYRNDEISISNIDRLNPDIIVLSPGPGKPTESGNCKEIVSKFHKTIPIFGVCLGFQLIVEFFGGKVIKGEQPMHGKISNIHHIQDGVFNSIPNPTKVTRYHSLIADSTSIPEELVVTARTNDGVIMGVRHLKHPIEGIQFHPESILTEHGFQMIENHYHIARTWKAKRGVSNESSPVI